MQIADADELQLKPQLARPARVVFGSELNERSIDASKTN
jgi:hypothetical protein